MESRYTLPALGAALVFISVVIIMATVTPRPLRPVDYFLGGGVGTLVACAALFFAVVRTSRLKNVFYKRRR